MKQNHVRQFNNSYIRGTAVSREDTKRLMEEAPSYSNLYALENEKKKAKRMNMSFVYIVFLFAALTVMGYLLFTYLRLQSDITKLVDNISAYESELDNLTLANDDEYSKISNVIDLDEIRRIAIEELDMVYPLEDQIVSYERENSDYVIQLSDLSD